MGGMKTLCMGFLLHVDYLRLRYLNFKITVDNKNKYEWKGLQHR